MMQLLYILLIFFNHVHKLKIRRHIPAVLARGAGWTRMYICSFRTGNRSIGIFVFCGDSRHGVYTIVGDTLVRTVLQQVCDVLDGSTFR